MPHHYVEENYIRKVLIVGLLLGLGIGAIAGGGTMYFTGKNKTGAELESMAQQLRLCEANLDKNK